MKKTIFLTTITSSLCILILGSCNKNSNNVWDDSSNMGLYKRANDRVLWDSSNQTTTASANTLNEAEDDFISLQDDDLKMQFSEAVFMQPKQSPGEDNSILPGIDGFQNATGSLSAIFKTIHFDTDDYSLKESHQALSIVKSIASYLKEHPKTSIFVTGNCDQRGPEAYNLALGTKRANAVRNSLIQHGANPEQIYTISYGKERLENTKNTPEAWAQNRRAQFKIYQRK